MEQCEAGINVNSLWGQLFDTGIKRFLLLNANILSMTFMIKIFYASFKPIYISEKQKTFDFLCLERYLAFQDLLHIKIFFWVEESIILLYVFTNISSTLSRKVK